MSVAALKTKARPNLLHKLLRRTLLGPFITHSIALIDPPCRTKLGDSGTVFCAIWESEGKPLIRKRELGLRGLLKEGRPPASVHPAGSGRGQEAACRGLVSTLVVALARVTAGCVFRGRPSRRAVGCDRVSPSVRNVSLHPRPDGLHTLSCRRSLLPAAFWHWRWRRIGFSMRKWFCAYGWNLTSKWSADRFIKTTAELDCLWSLCKLSE